jgi:signal transduction histidine kinase
MPKTPTQEESRVRIRSISFMRPFEPAELGYRARMAAAFAMVAVLSAVVLTLVADVAPAVQNRLLWVGLGMGVLFAGLGWLVAGYFAGPVNDLSCVADRLRRREHDVRLPHSTIRELDELSESLNRLVSTLLKREKELEEANEKLKNADRTKDHFLSVISHELRTPLNFIMGFASLLQDEVLGPLNDKQLEAMGKILAGADRMLMLVNDLLDFARLQAGRFQLSPVATDYRPVVDEVIATMQPLATQKKLTLSADVRLAGPVTLDPQRITQVLTNLVANAVKFTDHGEIRIEAFERDGQLVTEVHDTGMGIPPDQISKLFQRFSQLDMSPTRKVSGTGLGLSIAKAIVEAHGGQVGVRSEPGRGSTFWFTLPSR